MDISALHKAGFSLILLQPKRKQPVSSKWATGPKVALYDILEGVENDGCNVGFRPGLTSKTPKGRYIHGIDVDIRVDTEKDEAIAKLEELFGRKFLKQCGRVISGSGGASRHFYFTLSRPMRAKTVAHSKEKFFDEKAGKNRWKWEIEVFGEGKQMVLPPSIHPDTGKEYVWAQEPADLPEMEESVLDGILDSLTRPISEFAEEDLKPLGLEYGEAEDILSKLDFERYFVEREGWRDVGMALHHEFNGSKAAYKLWTEFSKKSDNFNSDEQRYQWSTFGRNTHVRPIRMATLMKQASEAEVRAALVPSEDDAEEIREMRRREKERKRDYKPRKKKGASYSVQPNKQGGLRIKQPQHLMTVPGVLGEIVDIFNASAPRPQPQFAVQAALALGSVICGRNWVTDMGNYSSLYFLILGPTASGKEHALKVIRQCLDQAEVDLIGQPRYTSDTGIMTGLELKPRQISLADEFSRYLAAGRSSGDMNQSNAQSTLMEIWGRLDGVHMNKGFSGRGMTKDQIEAMANAHIKRPALTMLGVATPEDFYNAMGQADVANGFLNRFLICDTEVDLMPMRKNKSKIEISADFRRWARENAYPLSDGDEDIMDAIGRNSPTDPGEAIEIPFTPTAKRLLDEIDEAYIEKMKHLREFGMDGLYGRAREIIMRLSLVVARSCGEDVITADAVEWSREYVEYHTMKLESKTQDDMGASDNQKIVNQLYRMIEEASEDDDVIGLSSRDMTSKCKPYRNLDTRGREEIGKLLAADFGVVIRQVKRGSSRKSIRVFTIREEE